MSNSRRNFLRGASGAIGLCAAAAAGRRFSFFERTAEAASVGNYGGYRAIVSVFLAGGNDANNMVIPYQDTGTPSYAQYSAVRSSAPNLQITQGEINNSGTWLGTSVYALHPSMPKLAALYNGATVANGPNTTLSPDGKKSLAIVFNVGTLVQPTSISVANGLIAKGETSSDNGTIPDHLFSHIDQQGEWCTAIANPSAFFANASAAQLSMQNTGWGGRAADRFVAFNPTVKVGGSALPFPSFTSYGGPAVFGLGEKLSPLSISSFSSGALQLNSSGLTAVNALIPTALSQMMANPSNVAPMEAFRAGFTQALDFSGLRTAARAQNQLPDPIAALFPDTTLGNQLLCVAQDIVAGAVAASSNGLGLVRELFATAFGSFDTHSNQLTTQAALLGELDDALFAFYTAIYELNQLVAAGQLPGVTAALEVTLFTQSDFSRTFLPNSNAGSDHGWGGHMLVLGDQVIGGKTYGKFPDLTLTTATIEGTSDVGEGRWLPTTSTDVYQNTLAFWLGITGADQPTVFPNLVGFTTKRLAFMNT